MIVRVVVFIVVFVVILIFVFVIFDATCVASTATSATAGCFFFSANCTGLCTTSATGTGTSGNGYTAAGQQADNSDSGKELFQFLCVHGLFSFARIRPLPYEKNRIYTAYNNCKSH